MRQAGRYMAEYRALRQRYSLLDICRQPDLAVAVTLQPVDVIDVDAAILFSDLLLPFGPMGLEFDFVKGEGPSIAHPIRHAGDVARLHSFDPREALRHVLDTITLLRRELVHRVPLIGFAGAPFTHGRVCDRGRSLDDLCQDQGVHVRAARCLARPL